MLIGEETYRLTRDAIRAEPVDPIAAKGKAEPVPAYRLDDYAFREGATHADAVQEMDRGESTAPMVGEGGVEPPRPFGHRNLNPARLPIPPLARGDAHGSNCAAHAGDYPNRMADRSAAHVPGNG